MGSARVELDVRLDETSAAAHFMDRAYRLRPRIGQAIRWDGPQHEVDLLRSFMVEDVTREEEILSALFLRGVATFERYLRKVCSEVVEARAERASNSGTLAPDLKKRNLILSARLLISLDSPKDYITFNPRDVVEGLAACEKGTAPYKLNAVSFSAFLQSPTVEAVEKMFANVGIDDIFESLGRSSTIQRMFGTHGTRATSERIQERLREIVRWRNNFAHGGDDERSLTIDDFDSVVAFFRSVADEIERVISDRLGHDFA